MTVIVWDGKVLATDRAATDGAAQWQTTKAWYFGEGRDCLILSGSGPVQAILQMRDWFVGGALRNEFPSVQLTSHFCHFVVVSPYVGLYRFEQGVPPIDHGYEPCAFGEGRDFALGAMSMGANAAKALEVANKHSIHCDLGVATYELEYSKDAI